MDATPLLCIRCHPPAAGDPPLTGTAHFICNTCQEHQRNPTRPIQARLWPEAPKTERKKKRKRQRSKSAAVSVLTALLLPLTACSVSWSGNLQLEMDPAISAILEPPPPAVSIPTPAFQPPEP